ncbi:MAG TPA: hypothetical protein VK961_24580 [Chthoniobacter sp.]|nr:hypothetical protein [Chthoniobacter sp.]
MKKITPARFFLIAFVALFIFFAAQTGWFLAFGRVVASSTVELGSVPHRVILRERCISDPITATLDRLGPGRVAEYEYWTELRSGRRLVAASDRETWDSSHYDYPRIDTADASGATVSLDPRLSYPSIYRFEWSSHPN